MNVSMTTLMTTTARPGDKVIISGCGPVGYLAAEIFRVSGYDIIIVEPDEQRRKLAKKNGILQTFSHIPLEDENIHGQIALVVECSGHEQAILDACKAVRRKGEVVMVGVPWRKCTDLTAHVLLWEVFHKYPVLRSGWEWELPIQSSHFSAQSIHSNLIKGLKWLSEGKIHLDNIISLHSPRDCQAVYKGHLLKTHRSLCTVFDWKN